MDLIGRLEEASEGSRELDCEIALAVGWKLTEYTGQGSVKQQWRFPGPTRGSFRSPPPYSTSLDAAMSLIPDGANTEMAMQDRHSKRWKWVIRDRHAVRHNGRAETAALAICIAALKAKAQP